MNPLYFFLMHVLFALWLAGGVLGTAVVGATARRATDTKVKAMAALIGWRMVAVLSIPGSLLAGLMGIHLVAVRGFQLSTPWVQASLWIWIAMLAIGLGYLAPVARRNARLAARFLADGSGESELKSALAKPLPGILAHVNALGLVALTWLMVMKPSF
jgi:uncharacterized membrane protein